MISPSDVITKAYEEAFIPEGYEQMIMVEDKKCAACNTPIPLGTTYYRVPLGKHVVNGCVKCVMELPND